MRKHTTQAEILRIQKLLRAGVTDIGAIQKQVFIHADSIQAVKDVFDKQNKPVKKPKKKAAVDPLS